MKPKLCLVVLLLILTGCNNPTSLPVWDMMKPADAFARGFIRQVINGQLDSCYAAVDPEKLTDSMRLFIANANRNLKHGAVQNIGVVEEYGTVGISDTFAYYKISYEYEFTGGNVLLLTALSKKDGRFYITGFNGQFLPGRLADLTRFRLQHQTLPQYIFLAVTIFVSLFILVSLFVMLFSKMKWKKKVLWALIILLLSKPIFYMDWGTGKIDFHLQLLYFNLFPAGMTRANLYSYWTLSFGLPAGAIIYWIRRKKLLTVPELELIPRYNEEVVNDTEK